MRSLAKRDIGALTSLIKTRLRRMHYRPVLLELSCNFAVVAT
jgi:hypothetical protein